MHWSVSGLLHPLPGQQGSETSQSGLLPLPKTEKVWIRSHLPYSPIYEANLPFYGSKYMYQSLLLFVLGMVLVRYGKVDYEYLL